MRYFAIGFLLSFFIIQATLQGIAAPQAQTAPQWIFFYSLKLQIDGTEAEDGAVIAAFVSRTGQHCGSQSVIASGALPLLTCYMADPVSGTDGATGGDRIFFTVNGVQVNETYQLPATIFNGQRFRLWDLTTDSTSKQSCVDGYEDDNTQATANHVTGPEAHTFYSRERGWDRDWSTFHAEPGYLYQIQARSVQPFAITHPVLSLYDEAGTMLEQNEMDKWGRGAELWWWQSDESATQLYLLAEEKQGQYGCRHYTLTIKRWKQAEFPTRFQE